VCLQIVQANIIAYSIARIWKWRFDWAYQPVSVLGCLTLGWLAHRLAIGLAGRSWPVPAVMASGAIVYIMLIAALVYVMPWLAGSTRTEVVLETTMIVRKSIAGFRST